MIRLRRLGHKSDAFYLNPDLIVSIEATPDTVVTLTTHSRVIVTDSADEVVAAVRAWRASILAAGLPTVKRRSDVPLSVVRGETPPPADPQERNR